ncbi:MAG: GntR family transcriptional regulator [Planctomycetes bacterium]|nr:GntR family transcriptional regulator [Planctomycetota bacterium]MCH9726184.1 GntR family transcriptional regulator [Planctomycetota bacterium]MCH9775689.1 GntR family transcriptional regulator [Planctomycetota bacterium]MCH9791347.1 GntR family transcriptional regulator [Planctomycetota bacterium]
MPLLTQPGKQRPKYMLLVDQLIQKVIGGEIRPGEALPSEHQLCESYQLARTTVRNAMQLLEEQGWITRLQGKGSFVSLNPPLPTSKPLDIFAFVLPEIRTGFYPSLQRSFEQAAALTQNQVLVCCTENKVDMQGNTILQLIDKHVSGVALVPATVPATPAYQIRQLQQHGIPVVFCHREVEGVQAPLLSIPFREVGLLAGQTLLQQGHHSLALFSPHRASSSIEYEAGLREALESQKTPCPEPFIFHGPHSQIHPIDYEQELLTTLESMFKRPDPPTAIFATFDSLAELIYLLLGKLGYRVPEDISLLGFGGTVRHGAIQSRLSSITVDEVAIGQKAAELLTQMKQGKLPIDSAEIYPMPIYTSTGQTLGPASQ